jgi:hypothetical protein
MIYNLEEKLYSMWSTTANIVAESSIFSFLFDYIYFVNKKLYT